jgi:hypothetical protein
MSRSGSCSELACSQSLCQSSLGLPLHKATYLWAIYITNGTFLSAHFFEGIFETRAQQA